MPEDSDDDLHTGTLILTSEPRHRLQWHHSVKFDGFVHTTACGRQIDTDHIQNVELDPVETWHETVTPSDGCGQCSKSVQELREEQDRVLTDGGRPGWHDCAVCGSEYRSRSASLRCCGDRFGGKQA